MASSEDRARLPRGLPETIRTRSWLFIRLYLFSDLLTNWGQREGRGDGLTPRSLEDLRSDPSSALGPAPHPAPRRQGTPSRRLGRCQWASKWINAQARFPGVVPGRPPRKPPHNPNHTWGFRRHYGAWCALAA